MIKVLQIGLGSNPGGIESCILNYNRHIDISKIRFEYADIYGKGIVHTDEILQLKGKVYQLHNYKKYPFRTAKELKEILICRNYDVVHINMLSAANLIPVKTACKYSRGAVIVHSHNSAVPSGILRIILNKLNLHTLRCMPVVKWGCGLKAGRWMWGDMFKADNVVPNAIEVDKFIRNSETRNVLREKCNFAEDNIVIGFVGRFSEQKNVLFTVNIMYCLLKKSSKYKLLLVGDGELRGELEKKVKDSGLVDKIYFAGIQNNVSVWYQVMDAFILPSFFEGMPVVGIEAQAAGLPCFVSDRVSDEIDLTGSLEFLPIDKGGKVWADAIDGKLRKSHWEKVALPKEYQIQYAVQQLEKKYKKITSNRMK